MKIDSSTIRMDAGHLYTQSTGYTKTVNAQSANGSTFHSSTTFVQNYAMYTGTTNANKALSQFDTFEKQSPDDANSAPLNSGLYANNSGMNIQLRDIASTMEEFRKQLVKQLEEFMERIRQQLWGHYTGSGSCSLLSSDSSSSSQNLLGSEEMAILDLTTNGNSVGSMWTIQTSETAWRSESEVTTFSGVGTVKTADGRSIDFNVSMEMTREFMEESTQLSEHTQYILTDPLVIQLQDAPEIISDETWLFDIDSDGTTDRIAGLSKGSGFLALDANDNGIIDDGSELFGTKSGNGFNDLAAYDDDGNGFIDENDAVFSRLKIWTKDESGNDQLIDLKGADIGAIYLGYANTQFSHNDLENNDTKAMVRNTGFYLHESTGSAGIVQQIDFVKQAV